MNEYILLWGDENIIDEWITIYPDEATEATEADLKGIAEDGMLWVDCVRHFGYCCHLIEKFG
jgi:hypothetical protein